MSTSCQLAGGLFAQLKWVWVPETLRTSRDLLIFVDQSTDLVASSDVVDLGCCAVGEWSSGGGLAQRAVRPMVVVMAFVLAQQGRGMALVR